jgi:hypothetical protein
MYKVKISNPDVDVFELREFFEKKSCEMEVIDSNSIGNISMIEIEFQSYDDNMMFLTDVLFDYETLGYELESDYPIYSTIFYFNDPYIQSMYIQSRTNIQDSQLHAIHNIILSLLSDNAKKLI